LQFVQYCSSFSSLSHPCFSFKESSILILVTLCYYVFLHFS
jgi:hypothetical protein